jgi:hypothetical protein
MDDNIKYSCMICNKNYKTYHTLWIHNKKFHDKKPKIKEYKCTQCNKIFDNKQNKYYHQKKCNIEKIETSIIEPSKDKIGTNIMNSNNNIINNGTINQHIVINNYNNDNLSYISEQFKERLFNNLLKRSEHSIPLPKLIENIKFNPNHKENNNVKITSDRSKIGLYYDHDKWKAINKNQLLDDMCDYSLKIFKQYFEEKKDELSENIVMQFASFSHIAELKSKLRQEIKDKIENIAYIFTKNNEDELDL